MQVKEFGTQFPNIRIVSKKRTIEEIKPALQLGHTLYGENQVQEAESKWPELRKLYPNIHLSLIGHLQSNKVKQALEIFDSIDSLDSEKLANSIAKNINEKSLTKDFLIQINIGEEEQKHGISPSETKGFIDYCRNHLKLPLKGLMCILPKDELPAPYFALMKKIAKENNINYLSMGMSSDYHNAVKFGTNELRIGSAIFNQTEEKK